PDHRPCAVERQVHDGFRHPVPAAGAIPNTCPSSLPAKMPVHPLQAAGAVGMIDAQAVRRGNAPRIKLNRSHGMRFPVHVAMATALLAAAIPAFAADTTSFHVKISILKACTITAAAATDVDFGSASSEATGNLDAD